MYEQNSVNEQNEQFPKEKKHNLSKLTHGKSGNLNKSIITKYTKSLVKSLLNKSVHQYLMSSTKQQLTVNLYFI